MTGQQAGGEESPRQNEPEGAPSVELQATDPNTGQSIQVPEEARHFFTLAQFIQKGANAGLHVSETAAAWNAMQALHVALFGAELQIVHGRKPAKE